MPLKWWIYCLSINGCSCRHSQEHFICRAAVEKPGIFAQAGSISGNEWKDAEGLLIPNGQQINMIPYMQIYLFFYSSMLSTYPLNLNAVDQFSWIWQKKHILRKINFLTVSWECWGRDFLFFFLIPRRKMHFTRNSRNLFGRRVSKLELILGQGLMTLNWKKGDLDEILGRTSSLLGWWCTFVQGWGALSSAILKWNLKKNKKMCIHLFCSSNP